MYPSYGGMSSYPYQRTQMPSTQYYLPSWDAARPRMKDDPAAAGLSSMYGSWPQNYGYTVSMQCPNCCNYAQYPPAYYNFRPPCPHFPCSPPAYGHFCGGYPSYPVNYVPPAHYPTELPRSEYDKNAPREFHCCGCLRHPCHLKEDKHVKIEEHEPEVETKKIESLVPAGANNYTQPILWIPPGYTTNKERQLPRRVVENEADRQQISPYCVKKPHWQRRPIETEVEEQQDSSRMKKLQWQRRPTESEIGEHVESPHVKKPQQSVKTVEQEPNVSYGWFPLDMNSIRELLEDGQGKKAHERETQGGDGENIQGVENKEQNKQFPFPIFWMPYGGQGENDVKDQREQDAEETPVKEASPTFKVIPMRFEYPDNEPEKIKTAVGDDDSGVRSLATEKTSTVKTIPVKQSEESVPKELKKDEEQKDVGKSVKSAEGNGNGQSSSPKKSKLPPICLRVDPPKKKNGNGSSRSPSPPGDKKRPESEEPKTGGGKKEIEVTEAVDKGSSQSKVEVSRKAGQERKEKLEGDLEKRGVEGQQSQEGKESKLQEAKKPAKVLSEQEAATIIQSVYHGYDVRRWEPLKKLRQIAKIREEAAEVKKRIEDLESRAASTVDEKEKATVAETIMKLLLKLDTVQGLPPSFRDVRRSVAKELIILQEKLDSIIDKKSTPMAHEISMAEEPSKVPGQDEGSKGVVETTEPSNISSQLEGSEVVETVKEPSNVSGLSESSRNISENAEEFSKALSSEGEDKSAKASRGDDEVPKLNEVFSGQPLASQDVVGGSEQETLETSPVKMETEGEPQDETASCPPVPTVADSQTDVKKVEYDGSEIIQGKPPAESQDQPASIGTVENSTGQVGMSFGHKDEQVHVLAILPEKVIEEKNEISDAEVNTGTALREESLECARNTPACEAPEVDLAPAKKDEELTQRAELAQEVTEEGVNEQTSEIPSSETLSRDQGKDQPADVKDKATLVIEPQNCKPESADSTSIEAQVVQEADPVDMNIPIVGQSEHGPEESTLEKHAPAEADSQVSDVPGTSTEEVEETRQSPQADVVECDSTMTSHENEVSCEGAREFVGGDQERTLEEKVPALGQQTVCNHKNLKDQSVRSETEAPQIVTQESTHEEEASKESKEGQEEEQINKRIIEENEKLREMLERLIASGKEQQDLISTLSGKVKDLEKQLARKNKMKSSKCPRVFISRASCGNGKLSNGSLRGRPTGVAS